MKKGPTVIKVYSFPLVSVSKKMNLEITIKKEEDFDYFDIHRGLEDFSDSDKENKRDASENMVEEEYHVVLKTPVVNPMNSGKPLLEDASQTDKVNGDKKFQCQECSKCFRWNCLLIRHQNTVHKRIKPYQCDECGIVFLCEVRLPF